MAAYEHFAQVYDTFMDNIPYDEWCAYLHGLLAQYGVADGLVLELGCGTGEMTERHDILYLLQDMRAFELYGTVRAVVSVCDSINYVTDAEELATVFSLVNNYLDPGGVFIFDLNTVGKYRELGESVIAENRDEGSFIWENWYDEETRINEYDLTLFLRQESGLYEKYEETHYQRAYEIGEIKAALARAGLKLEAVFDAFTQDAPRPDSERVYFVARECGK